MSTYKLIDSGQFLKLEQVGAFKIVRPSASAVWDQSLPASEWKKIDAEFKRYSDGQGEWKVFNEAIKKPWSVQIDQIQMQMKLTGFGHLGLFAEQETNWIQLKNIISQKVKAQPEKKFNVLNLFAYTGGSTLFSALAGASVVHLDASKSAVNWARTNAELSGLKDKPIRWIVDDVQEFVEKEIRRGSKYQGIILDPPSYGRGQKNQVWKIESHLMPLLKNLKKITDDDLSFILLSAHSPGYTPVSLENQLRQIGFAGAQPAARNFISGEMLITDVRGQSLPSGTFSFFKRE